MIEENKDIFDIVENSDELIAKLNFNGIFLYASPKLKQIIYNNESLVGKDINEIKEKIGDNTWYILVNSEHSMTTTSVKTINGLRWIKWHLKKLSNYYLLVGHDVTDIIELNKKLKYESEYDNITGLYSRNGLIQALNENKNADNIVLLSLTIYGHNNIYNFYGQEIYNLLLMKIGNAIQQLFTNKAYLSRITNSLFFIALVDADLEKLKETIKDYLSLLNKNYMVDNIMINIKFNIGYAVYPEDTKDINNLLLYSSMAMNEVLKNNKIDFLRVNNQLIYDVENRLNLATELSKSITNNEFKIVFQPILDHHTNEIIYIESLARLNHTTLGDISPMVFLKLAEESGIMYDLDLLLMTNSLNHFAKLRQCESYRRVKLSLNISSISLYDDKISDYLLHQVEGLGLKTQDICIEISEKTFMNDTDHYVNQINKLREYGFLIAIDDFGRDYSSLSILNKVAFDVLKIDSAFTQDLSNDVNFEVIRMVTNIANVHNKVVIAEGIETFEQVETLKNFKDILMQGYYFGKPQELIV